MVFQTSRLCRVPQEVLENIALELVMTQPLGPPEPLIPLLQTCQEVHQRLRNSLALQANIFKAKFDLSAAIRRFESEEEGLYPTSTSFLATQLKFNCVTLHSIKSGDVGEMYIADVLWNAFHLMLENDGKNKAQLVDYAGLDSYIDKFVRERLMERNEFGWPADNPVNALALWLMWMTTTEENLRAESEPKRQEIISLVLPYVILSFRYPTAHIPPNHFHVPLPDDLENTFPYSFNTVHGPYPLYRNPGEYFQRCTAYNQDFPIACPLITIAAKLIHFSRRSVAPFAIPPHLPVTRAQAIQLGHHAVRPTQEDIIEFNAHPKTILPPTTPLTSWGGLSEDNLNKNFLEASMNWDHDWARMVFCLNPFADRSLRVGQMYTPGMLTGLWQGSMLIPNEPRFARLLSVRERPLTFSESDPQVATVPIYMRLLEHHCISPELPINAGGSRDGFDDGLGNAYFPTMRMDRREDGILVNADDRDVLYETHVPGRPNSHNEDTCQTCLYRQELPLRRVSTREYETEFASVGLGMEVDGGEYDNEEDMDGFDEPPNPSLKSCTGIQDIIFTGETDLRHGQAWNHYTFLGRVRTWDGLIAILRIPADRRMGNVILYGYLVGGQNFVGTWRGAGEDVGVPTWESAFSMSRRNE